MIIACDIDNTVCNLQEAVLELFNKNNGTNYTLNDFEDYNIENVLSIKEAVKIKEMYASKTIYNNVKPIAKAQESLQKLVNEGHQVYLVTDAIPKNYAEKVAWINHFFPFIDNAHIVAMKHKHLFKCDVLIEDNVQNLISGLHYDRILLNYPWNQKVHDEVYGIYRCNNWNEIMKAINKIKQECDTK